MTEPRISVVVPARNAATTIKECLGALAAQSLGRESFEVIVAVDSRPQDGTAKTLDEVARIYGITRERIRQIEARGLLKLRQPTRSQRLEEFADVDEE